MTSYGEFALCNDLLKKWRQLAAMPKTNRDKIAQGLIDGLMGATVQYPGTQGELGIIPPIRPSFDPLYEAGYDVGQKWQRIAQKHQETLEAQP